MNSRQEVSLEQLLKEEKISQRTYDKVSIAKKYIERKYGLTLDLPSLLNFSWLSPRYISIGQLNTLLYLHLQPINQLVFLVSYYLTVWDILS